MAEDDGMNAAGGNDSSGFNGPGFGGDQFASAEGAYICISGGIININAYGDGIDSNGSFEVSGGETYLSGPVNSGNGSLDYSTTAVITSPIKSAHPTHNKKSETVITFVISVSKIPLKIVLNILVSSCLFIFCQHTLISRTIF